MANLVEANILSLKYNALVREVRETLTQMVKESKEKSRFMDLPALKVNIYDYEEMVFVNDELIFVDGCGLHYGLWTECDLEDLIDIVIAKTR
jgi:hypothetical protein